MAQLVEKALEFLRDVGSHLSMRRERTAIDSLEGLCEFVTTRASFITQKTHYGYLRTRMGLNYPKMFAEDTFIASVNIANMHIFAACLSDLTIHAVARAFGSSGLADAQLDAVALTCYRHGLAGNPGAAGESFSSAEAEQEFAHRLEGTEWRQGASRPENFTRSPKALVKWAPIAPELKKHDVEIVENSIRFAWQDVRAQLDRRLDAEAVLADFHAGSGATAADT